jgi:hypothetical protein
MLSSLLPAMRHAHAADLYVGATAVVTGAPNGLKLRVAPSTSATSIGKNYDGTIVTVVDGPRTADGYTWWQLETPIGTGWSADAWLALAETSLPPPTLLSADAKPNGAEPGIEIEWTEVPGATDYEVYRDDDLYTTVDASYTTFWNHANMTAGETYTYYVVAIAAGIASPPSNSRSCVAPGASVPLSAPDLVSVSPKMDGTKPGIAIRWTAVPGATGYQLYRDGELHATVGA